MDEPLPVEVDGAPRGRPGGGRFWMLVPGFAFLGLGVLVLVVPQVVAVMVATVFFLIGFGLLLVASKVRRVQRRFTALRQDIRGRW